MDTTVGSLRMVATSPITTIASAIMTIHGFVTERRGRSGRVILSTRHETANAAMTDKKACRASEGPQMHSVESRRRVAPTTYKRVHAAEVVHLLLAIGATGGEDEEEGRTEREEAEDGPVLRPSAAIRPHEDLGEDAVHREAVDEPDDADVRRKHRSGKDDNAVDAHKHLHAVAADDLGHGGEEVRAVVVDDRPAGEQKMGEVRKSALAALSAEA